MSTTEKKIYGPYGVELTPNQEVHYPTLVYKEATFKSFSELREFIIKTILTTYRTTYVSSSYESQGSTSIKMYEPHEIKEKIYGIRAKDIPNYYDSKIKSLSVFLTNVNSTILKYSKDGKIGGKRDVYLRYKFKKYRKYQPKCEGDKFFIPGFFTSSSKRYVDNFNNESSSSANKKIYNGVKVCFDYLKKILISLFKYSLGESFDKYKTHIENFIDYELKLKYISISGNTYKYEPKSFSLRGGSRKNIKHNSTSKSRSKVLKSKTLLKTKNTLKKTFKKLRNDRKITKKKD